MDRWFDFMLELRDFLLSKECLNENRLFEIDRCLKYDRKLLRSGNDLQINLAQKLRSHLDIDDSFIEELKNVFCDSIFQIQIVTHVQNNLNVKFIRFKLIEQVLTDVSNQDLNYGQFFNGQKMRIELDNDCKQSENLNALSLTDLRSQLYLKVVKKLYEKNGFEIGDDSVAKVLRISTKRRQTETIFCGPVLDSKSKRINSTTSANEFFANRASYMEMIATHRYGLRNSRTCIDWQSIGQAAVIFELIGPKINRAISINSDHIENHKGAVFVLYNYARICSILKKFEQLTTKEIEPVNSIDYKLLSTDEEWCLVYDYLLKYPYLIRTSIGDEPKIHQIFAFVEQFCASFSVYYRRIQILVEPHKHLINQLNARITLLKALRIVLLNILNLLDIQPLECM